MTSEQLLSKVFNCSHCVGIGLPFVSGPSDKWYRFPPTIGARTRACLLFVGINPRVSNSNRALHESIVKDYAAFKQLSMNRVGEDAYIGRAGLERHYALHVRVADELFPGQPFESVAAVTELHFCASSSSVGLPRSSSKCARHYFEHVLAVVSPAVVFAVGKHVERTLLAELISPKESPMAVWHSGKAPVITLPHPNARGRKKEVEQAALEKAERHLQISLTRRCRPTRDARSEQHN